MLKQKAWGRAGNSGMAAGGESQDLLNNLLDKHAAAMRPPRASDARTLEHLLANNVTPASGANRNQSLRGLSGSSLLELLTGSCGLNQEMAQSLVTACTTGDVLATYGEADFAECGIDIADPKLEPLKQVFLSLLISNWR